MDPIHLLQLLGGGKFLHQFYAAMESVAADVVRLHSGGSVTISIKIAPQKGGDEHMLNVATSVLPKSPAEPEAVTWLHSFDGQLFRDDPRQVQMEFRAVESGSQLRVPEDTGKSVREVS